jgi:hypothetical protein
MIGKQISIALALSLVLLPVLYVLSYLALANHRTHSMGHRNPAYRFGGEYAEMFFWPMECLDRRLRYWGPVG